MAKTHQARTPAHTPHYYYILCIPNIYVYISSTDVHTRAAAKSNIAHSKRMQFISLKSLTHHKSEIRIITNTPTISKK